MKELIDLARRGASVSLYSLWGAYSRKEGIRLSITKETNNGICTLNCELTNAELDAAEDPEALVTGKLLEMERKIRR